LYTTLLVQMSITKSSANTIHSRFMPNAKKIEQFHPQSNKNG